MKTTTTIILVGEDQQVIDIHRVDSHLPALAEMRTISFTERGRGNDNTPLNRMKVYEVLGYTQSLELLSEGGYPFTVDEIGVFMKVKELGNIENIEQETERIHGVKLSATEVVNESDEQV